MKYLVVILMLAVLVSSGSAVTKTISRVGDRTIQTATGTYANSQVDTVKMTYEAGITAMAFGVYVADSVSITTAILRRVVNGVAMPVIAGDTLTTFSSLATTAAGSYTEAMTLAPLAETYWVIVTYAGSANGVTSANVKYYQITQHP